MPRHVTRSLTFATILVGALASTATGQDGSSPPSALTDDRAVTDKLFLSVLGRSPTTDERGDVTAALAGVVAKDRPAVVAELTWAGLASAEFRFNH